MKKLLSKIFIFFIALFVTFGVIGCSSPNDLTILYETDNDMINNYSLIAVKEDAPFKDTTDYTKNASPSINTIGADAFINWCLSKEGLKLISNYGKKEYKEYLFYLTENHPETTSTVTIPKATEKTKEINISTTTSVKDSGLLGYIVPIFEKEYGYEVVIVSAGTGKAINNAKAGNADLILVHSKKQEEAFINDGFARVVDGFTQARLNFMYNYFVLIGPKADPANVKDAANVKEAFKLIADGEYTFISRADNSGTHTKEISLWDTSLGITADATSYKDYSWYVGANAGMGACLSMAYEQQAYILSDKATFLTFKANGFKVE